MPEYPTLVNCGFLDHQDSRLSSGLIECGTRHRNWRELWSNFVSVCPTRMTDAELMQSVLCLVLPDNEDNKHTAKLLIDKYGSFTNAISAPLLDHDYIKNFPIAAGIAFKFVHAAAQRLAQRTMTNRLPFSDQKYVKNYLTTTLIHKGAERVHVLFIDSSERLLADETLANGISPSDRLDPAEVIKRALNCGAAAVALVQQSTNPNRPRIEDRLGAIEQIRDLCERLNICFREHYVTREP